MFKTKFFQCVYIFHFFVWSEKMAESQKPWNDCNKMLWWYLQPHHAC